VKKNFSLVFEKRHDVYVSASCDFYVFLDRPAGRAVSGRVGSQNLDPCATVMFCHSVNRITDERGNGC